MHYIQLIVIIIIFIIIKEQRLMTERFILKTLYKSMIRKDFQNYIKDTRPAMKFDSTAM